MVLMWKRGGTKTRVFTVIAYLILCSRVVWLLTEDFSGLIGFILSNAYVWLMLAMLFVTPGLPPNAEPKLGSLDVGSARLVKLPRAVRV
jgi:alpha-1,2-mannosyltransferase